MMLATILIAQLSIASDLSANEVDSVHVDSNNNYLYNGITYMSMQAEDMTWMDTVWSLELESLSNNLFDLVLSPAPKRINIKVLSSFRSEDWVAQWNNKLIVSDRVSGLEQGEYASKFMALVQYLPETLQENDHFSIEAIGDAVRLSINDEVLATVADNNQFGFWMSAWMSASKIGIYADGDMLANGNIESYLVELLEDDAPSLEPSLIAASSNSNDTASLL